MYYPHLCRVIVKQSLERGYLTGPDHDALRSMLSSLRGAAWLDALEALRTLPVTA